MNSALPVSFNLDLANATRIIGSAIDIGAYEYRREIASPPSAPSATAVPTLGQCALLSLCAGLGLVGTRRVRKRQKIARKSGKCAYLWVRTSAIA